MNLPLQPIDVDHLRRSEARWLHAYWKSKVAQGEMPRCESISLGEMRSVAPDLLTLEPTGVPGELRYRVVGSAITARFGVDLTGKTLYLDSTGSWATIFLEAIATRRPAALHGRISGGDSGWANFEVIVLPLAAPVAGGISLLAGMFFFAS